ncbi:unnamed protein product [Musa acuminata subsp. burmannicoides]
MTLLLLVGMPQLQFHHAIAVRDYQPATRSCRGQQATRSNFGSTSSSSPPLIYLLLRVHGTSTHKFILGYEEWWEIILIYVGTL